MNINEVSSQILHEAYQIGFAFGVIIGCGVGLLLGWIAFGNRFED